VIAVVARVVQIVMAAGRLRETGSETRVGPAGALRRHSSVVSADPRVVTVERIAVREQRGDVVRTHEGQGQKGAGRRRHAGVALARLYRAIGHLAGVRPPRVLDRLMPGGQRGIRLRRSGRQKHTDEGKEKCKNPHSLETRIFTVGSGWRLHASDLVKFRK